MAKEITARKIKIPDGYNVFINTDNSSEYGDTVYNYTIVNPETGQKDTIYNYVTNNYTFTTTNNNGDTNINEGNNSGSGGSLNGNITVGGRVDLGGKVDVGVDVNVNVPDININVNGGDNNSSGGNPNDYIDPGDINTNLDDYLQYIPEVSKGFIDYLKDFFSWLPPPVFGILMLGLIVAVFCRLTGR